MFLVTGGYDEWGYSLDSTVNDDQAQREIFLQECNFIKNDLWKNMV